MATRRLYYDDAYEKEFEAQVMHCEVLPPDLKSGITGAAWGLILDRTAFYPTSGGQPHDLGKIGDANVLDVREEGEEVLHVVTTPVIGDVPGTVRIAHRLVSFGCRDLHH